MKKFAVAPALFCLVLQAFALDVAVSPPVGGMTVTLAGSSGGVPKISTFAPAMRMTLSSSFVGKPRGTLTQVTATALTDSSAGWTVGQLSTPATPYYVKITTGAAAGSWWPISTSTASSPTTVNVISRGITPVQAGILIGDGYEIVPADTLKTLFAQIEDQIGGPNAGSADIVQIHDGISWREFHFNTSAGGWREGTSTRDRNNIVVGPDSGVVYFRRGSSPATLMLLGNVPTSAEKYVVGSTGVASVANVFPTSTGRTISSFGVHLAPGFIQNTGLLSASDKIRVYDGIGWRTFNFVQATSQWREGTSTRDRNGFEISPGSTIVIERGSGVNSAFFVTLTPPYSL